MLSFLNRHQNRQDKRSSKLTQLTLNTFFDEHYFPHAQVNKRLTNHDWSIYNTHLRVSLGQYRLHDITNPTLDIWVREQLLTCYRRSTVNKHINLMNRLLNLARHWGHIENHNPSQQNIKALQVGDYTQRFLSDEEIERLLKKSRLSTHPYIHLLVQLLLLTGARKGEAQLALWRDIDFNKRVWTVPRSKNGRSRRIILSTAAVDVFNAVRAKSDALELPNKQENYVFTNPKSRTAYKSFDIVWFKVRAQAELSDVRMHDLRHTFASVLINRGVSLYEVQTLLGHSSPQMTQRYAHLAPDLLHKRTELVGELIVQASI